MQASALFRPQDLPDGHLPHRWTQLDLSLLPLRLKIADYRQLSSEPAEQIQERRQNTKEGDILEGREEGVFGIGRRNE